MGSNPINLALRFLLEIVTLVSAATWGWYFSDGWTQYLMAIGMPIMLAIIWGTFAVPGDPSRSGSAPIVVPGLVRLLLELLIFMFGAWTLYDLGHPMLASTFTLLVVVHYSFSYDRILWLISKK